MDIVQPATKPKRNAEKGWPRRVYDFLSGFHVATGTLLLLLVLTWLATLEQIDHGLYPTLLKYFSWKTPFMQPEINGHALPIFLPGGYYVSALLLVNMILGGIIRIRKGWRQIGNLISHFGIVFMLIGGGVAHHFSERGNMAVGEGESSDVAEDYFEYVIEVGEIKDGKEIEKFHVIRGNYLTDLEGDRSRTFSFPDVPFKVEVSGYLKNAAPVSQLERAPENNELVTDGFYLAEKPSEVKTEANMAGAYARIVFDSGEKSEPFILAGASFYPFTVRDGEREFFVDMRKRLWPMNFEVELDVFTADFYPGTNRPAKFISEIRRIENEQESKVTIQMNEPMRYEGLTFFQASYGPARREARRADVFSIRSRPEPCR